MKDVFDSKIEEITDGFLVVIISAIANKSSGLKKSYAKNQDFLDIIGSIGLEKRIILRKKLLKEVKEISGKIVEEINELTTCSKH